MPNKLGILNDNEYYSVLERTGASRYYEIGTRNVYFRKIIDHFYAAENVSRLDMIGALEVLFHHPLLFCHLRFNPDMQPPVIALVNSGVVRQFLFPTPADARAAALFILHRLIHNYTGRDPLPDTPFTCVGMTILRMDTVQRSIPSHEKFAAEVASALAFHYTPVG